MATASVPPTHSYFPTSFTSPFFGVPPVNTTNMPNAATMGNNISNISSSNTPTFTTTSNTNSSGNNTNNGAMSGSR